MRGHDFVPRIRGTNLAAQIYFFNELLPPEGDFSAHIYFFPELLPPEGD